MNNPLRETRNIQQKLLSSKEIIKSVISYNKYRRDHSVCSNKELEQKLNQLDRDIARVLELLGRLERDQRRNIKDEKIKESQSTVKK